jgi:hypothetical protein
MEPLGRKNSNRLVARALAGARKADTVAVQDLFEQRATVDAASRMKSTTERIVSPGFALLVMRSRPVSRAAFFIDGALSRFAGVNLGAIVVEHEKTDRR